MSDDDFVLPEPYLSRYGPAQGMLWHFEETVAPFRKGSIRAITETEALDRIDEAWPDRKAMKWTGRSK